MTRDEGAKREAAARVHLVDPNDRGLDSDDLATWLLFYLEAHAATVTLTPTSHVQVNLDTMPGLTADVVGRWAPVITRLLPEFRALLLKRAAVVQ